MFDQKSVTQWFLEKWVSVMGSESRGDQAAFWGGDSATPSTVARSGVRGVRQKQSHVTDGKTKSGYLSARFLLPFILVLNTRGVIHIMPKECTAQLVWDGTSSVGRHLMGLTAVRERVVGKERWFCDRVLLGSNRGSTYRFPLRLLLSSATFMVKGWLTSAMGVVAIRQVLFMFYRKMTIGIHCDWKGGRTMWAGVIQPGDGSVPRPPQITTNRSGTFMSGGIKEMVDSGS
ncbi:hypothetical protein B0F90DRAFT_1672551 [Multifurca ochricompacta]|uniref:Uncharacterized protein n=1 Tax=Multifurca ochricompacta TaxID=376703 RepID=A0AAD4QIL0_9AGAM|nr:hypothetical protein B0F90DRAFT_1672551 [Multifurca ochricompacta]